MLYSFKLIDEMKEYCWWLCSNGTSIISFNLYVNTNDIRKIESECSNSYRLEYNLQCGIWIAKWACCQWGNRVTERKQKEEEKNTHSITFKHMTWNSVEGKKNIIWFPSDQPDFAHVLRSLWTCMTLLNSFFFFFCRCS